MFNLVGFVVSFETVNEFRESDGRRFEFKLNLVEKSTLKPAHTGTSNTSSKFSVLGPKKG